MTSGNVVASVPLPEAAVIEEEFQTPSSPRGRILAIAVAAVAVCCAGLLPIVHPALSRQLGGQLWNLQIIGAIGIFAAARVGFWPAVGFLGLAIAFKDTSIYLKEGWGPSPYSWPYFIGYAIIGWALLRRSRSSVIIGAAAMTGALYFYLISNFVCWLGMPELYARSLEGLVDCYIAAIPFFRGTIAGDLLFTPCLFAAHALLCHAYRTDEESLTVRQQS